MSSLSVSIPKTGSNPFLASVCTHNSTVTWPPWNGTWGHVIRKCCTSNSETAPNAWSPWEFSVLSLYWLILVSWPRPPRVAGGGGWRGVEWTECNTECNTLQHSAMNCNTLQRTATQSATQCNELQHSATHCNTLHRTWDVVKVEIGAVLDEHTATHCNTL